MKQIVLKTLHWLESGTGVDLRKAAPGFLKKKLGKTPVHIVSFPKCGRSWLRLMIGDALFHQLDTPKEQRVYRSERWNALHPAVPRVRVTHDDNPHLKTPEEIATDKLEYRNRKVIFLARDPRDVIVSWFFHYQHRLEADRKFPAPDDIYDFTFGERGGLASLVKFFNIWMENRHIPKQYMLLTYEALREDTYQRMQEVLSLMELNQFISESNLRTSIEHNAFDQLKKREMQREISDTKFGGVATDNQDALKVRRGKVGGFTDYFDPQQVDTINRYLRDNLRPEYLQIFNIP